MSIFILQGIALGFSAAVQPGPFMAYILSQTMANGFIKTWKAALAPLISDGPIILLAVFLLAQIPIWLQRGLFLSSGVFILYLAWGSYKQWSNFAILERDKTSTEQHGLFKAALMNALSPMPYIYWSLVTGPILLAGWRENPAYGLGFLAAFYIILIGGLMGMMALFSAARNLGNKISRAFLGISVLALAVFGMIQLWRGLFG
jgi:threonine/homoserine/homoserine lactone efflux protein